MRAQREICRFRSHRVAHRPIDDPDAFRIGRQRIGHFRQQHGKLAHARFKRVELGLEGAGRGRGGLQWVSERCRGSHVSRPRRVAHAHAASRRRTAAWQASGTQKLRSENRLRTSSARKRSLWMPLDNLPRGDLPRVSSRGLHERVSITVEPIDRLSLALASVASALKNVMSASST